MAILARALGIPAVVGVSEGVFGLHTGDLVILNGDEGEVIFAPDESVFAEV